jgi:two-component system chemotaxis sensor kinase CheA
MTDDMTQDNDFLVEMVNELRASFKEEANELLAELESALLELEKKPSDKNQIERVFRAMHTLKGSGGACEFNDVVRFTHEVETIFDLVRNGKVAVTNNLINLTLLARDQIKILLSRYYEGKTVDDEQTERILSCFRDELCRRAEQLEVAPILPQQQNEGTDSLKTSSITYSIRFRPHEDIFDKETILKNFLNRVQELGTCKITANTEEILYLENIEPEKCHIYWNIILATNQGMIAVQEVVAMVKDYGTATVDVIDSTICPEYEEKDQNADESLFEHRDDGLKDPKEQRKNLEKESAQSDIIAQTPVSHSAPERLHGQEKREQYHLNDSYLSIRVSTKKLDTLFNLVGELVTVQARLSQTAAASNVAGLASLAEEVERLTADIRENTMQVRMISIGTTFNKYKRLVRDLSRELGKEVEMTTDGADTELDKTVIERLGDPLIHIIRNCISHGIESPEVREQLGKPRKGTIHLSGVHSGSHVLIQIRDDGAGLDGEAIRAKAIEKELLQVDSNHTEREIWNLIFTPGFSTAEQVTDVSGRGVGLDVVKRAIDSLRGDIEVDSLKGFGTTITLKLPLTLAIIDGLLVEIQKQHYVIPISYIQECVEHRGEHKKNSRGREIASVRGQIVPYINLRKILGIQGPHPSIEQIVITETNGLRVGFVVDSIVGNYQTVIKDLGKYYEHIEEVSGATILGDGSVALILDIPQLIRAAERREIYHEHEIKRRQRFGHGQAESPGDSAQATRSDLSEASITSILSR